ncbi:MAG: hypothetical protein ABJN69_12210 [Hellea sp.]
MKSRFPYHWLVGAFISLFFALQSYSLSHASAYGDAPHEHDGIACSVTVISSDHTVIIPAAPITPTIVSDAPETFYVAFTSARYVSSQSRAPPPRGPPTSI